MGSHPATVLILLAAMGSPATAIEPGWHYSPLPGEGDRATLGCDREATDTAFTCLAVRCEDDYATGLHVHASRDGVAGLWEMTIDRENAELLAEPSTPYGGRFIADADWLLERLKQGTFVYLRHTADTEGRFAYIDLGGSLFAIHRALAWCAPREPKAAPDVN
jgi:hypothetical protein